MPHATRELARRPSSTYAPGVKRDEPRAPKPGAADEAAPAPRVGCFAGIAALVLVLGGAYAYRTWGPTGDDLPAPSAAPSVVATPTFRRCVEVAPRESYVVGPAPAERPAEGDDLDRDDLLSPFAVILGRAVAIEGGYALGVLGDGDGGSLATVVTVDADAKTGKTVRLSRSRGDLDPPVVVAVPGGGSDLLVAFLEPDASGRAPGNERARRPPSWERRAREADRGQAPEVRPSKSGPRSQALEVRP